MQPLLIFEIAEPVLRNEGSSASQTPRKTLFELIAETAYISQEYNTIIKLHLQ
jgi:hypothetical protein